MKRFLSVFLLLFGSVGATWAVAPFTVTQTLASSPTFVPGSSPLGGISGCNFGNPTGARNYVASAVTVTTSGLYEVRTTSNPNISDPFIAIYNGTFDPNNPTVGLVGCNDDFTGYDPGVDVTLNVGTTYTFVTTVYNSGTTSTGTITYTATYGPAPTVTSVSPNSGDYSGGTSVTITGTTFNGATAVTFGGVAATSFTVVQATPVSPATQITAVTPASSVASAVSVVVTTPNGSNAANTLYTYTGTPPAAVPTLSEWGQLMLALMVIGIAWHFHNNRQNSY